MRKINAIFALVPALFLCFSCSKEQTNDEGKDEEKKEETLTLKEKLFNSLTELKEATSYRSSFSKEGISKKEYYYTQNYIYSSKTGTGHILLSGFTSTTSTASFAFSSEKGVIDIGFAEVDDNGNYISSLDSFCLTKKLSITQDMLTLNDDESGVILTDATNISYLLDLIGNDEEDPYDVESVLIKYNYKDQLSLTFKDEEGNNFDEATITDINEASYKTAATWLETNASTYLAGTSLTDASFSNLKSDAFKVTMTINKLDAFNNSKLYQTRVLEKTASSIFRSANNSSGSLIEEKKYSLDSSGKIKESQLTVENKVRETDVEGKWSDLYSDYFEGEAFKLSSDNTYKYYGGFGDEILKSLTGSEDFGSVAELNATVTNNEVTSLFINSLGENTSENYSITVTIEALSGEATALSPKESTVETEKLKAAFEKLKYSKDTTGFKTIEDARYGDKGSGYVETIYTKDAVLNYNLNSSDKIEYGTGYKEYDGKIFEFEISGSYAWDEENSHHYDGNCYTYNFSNGEDLVDGSISSHWFNLLAAPEVFYPVSGKENTYKIYDGLLDFQTATPLDLYDNETVDDMSVTLDSKGRVSKMEFTCTLNIENPIETTSEMLFYYGDEYTIFTESQSSQIDTLSGQIKIIPTSFLDESLVYNNLANKGEYVEEEHTNPFTDEEISDIPYIYVKDLNWTCAPVMDMSTFSTNYNQFEIYANFMNLDSDSYNGTSYASTYNSILSSSSDFTLKDGWYEHNTLDLKIKCTATGRNQDYGEDTVIISVYRK